MSVSKFNPVNIFGRDAIISKDVSFVYYTYDCWTFVSGSSIYCTATAGNSWWGVTCWGYGSTTNYETVCSDNPRTRVHQVTGTLNHYWTFVGFRLSGGYVNITFGYSKSKSAYNNGGYTTTTAWDNSSTGTVDAGNYIICIINGTEQTSITPTTASSSSIIDTGTTNANSRSGRAVFTTGYTSISQITSVGMKISSGMSATTDGNTVYFYTPLGVSIVNTDCAAPETKTFDVSVISPGLTVVKTCPNYGRALLLPSASSANGKQFIIKNLLETTSNYSSANINAHTYGYTKSVIICTTDNSNIDDDQTSFTMTKQYQCVVLTSDGTNWWIIGNYIGDLATSINVISATRYLYAAPGINVLNTSSSGRVSGDNNVVVLPTPAVENTGRMLIVAVGGSYTNNNTWFMVNNNSAFDGSFTASYALKAGTAGYPTGAIFVCDGTNWHLVGYFNTTNVVFDNTVLISGGTAKVSNNYAAGSDNHLCRTYVSATQTLTTDWQSVIFPTALPRAERSYCCIYKSRNSTYGNASYVLHPLTGGATGSSTTNTLNYPNGYARMWMNGVRARYTVYWIVGIIDGSYIRWFTVMNRNDDGGPGGGNPSASPAGVTPITPT